MNEVSKYYKNCTVLVHKNVSVLFLRGNRSSIGQVEIDGCNIETVNFKIKKVNQVPGGYQTIKRTKYIQNYSIIRLTRIPDNSN